MNIVFNIVIRDHHSFSLILISIFVQFQKDWAFKNIKSCQSVVIFGK
jgi:hypothetical protein